MNRVLIGIMALGLLAGCTKTDAPAQTSSTSTTGSAADPAVPVNDPAMIMHMTGQIRLGDTLEAAKKAAPAPKDAQLFDTSLSFAILDVQGWAWSSGENESFEVALEDGKVIAIAHTRLNQEKANPTDDMRIDTRPADRSAEKPTAKMKVWENGDNARIEISFYGKGLFGTGTITMIGPKSKLKLLNYDAADPETFVTQYDNAAKQIEKAGK